MATGLEEIAAASDSMTRDARAMLTAAVRDAHREGLSQREIARRIGRSQPEVSRLIRFHGSGPLARRLRAHRQAVIHLIEDAGGRNVRVFGSVATGREHAGSDIDLLADLSLADLSLLDLERLQSRLTEEVGATVELTPDSGLRPYLRERVLKEAVPL